MKKVIQILTILICCTIYANDKYSFYLISDTHFGSLASFGENPIPKLKRKGVREKAAIPLFEAMFQQMKERHGNKNAFLIHTGDLIEGNGASKDFHIQQFVKAQNMLKKYFTCPIYMVRGNHEGAGKYGLQAYRKYIAPQIATLAGQPKNTIHYTIRYGEDIFIFVDAYTRGWQNFIYNTVDSLKKTPRYLFLVLHSDLLPHANMDVVKICQKIGKYNAIILSGHTHRTRLLKYTRDGKTTAQFSIGSHLTTPVRKMRYTQKNTNLDDFLKPFCQLRVRTPRQKAIFEGEIKPFLSNYVEYHDGSNRFLAQGYAQLKVNDSGVTAVIQSGDLTQKTFEIEILKRKISGDKK